MQHVMLKIIDVLLLGVVILSCVCVIITLIN